VVDDDADIVRETVQALRHQGIESEGSVEAKGIATRVKHEKFDLVLLDIHMPEYGGLRVLQDLAVAAPHTKVVMMSARSDIDDVLECIRHGAVDFVGKPFDTADLAQRLKINLKRPQFTLVPSTVREHLIESLWANVQTETGSTRGRRLEQLLFHLFESVNVFRDVRTNLRGDVDEVDVEAVNDGDSLFWRDSGSLIVAECKNWSKNSRSAGIQEYDHFSQSLRRSTRYKVGLFISMSGFSKEFHFGRIRDLHDGRVVVPVDEKELGALVRSPDRAKTLEDWIRRYSR
jgi:DNA-binding response OmpR family regulator